MGGGDGNTGVEVYEEMFSKTIVLPMSTHEYTCARQVRTRTRVLAAATGCRRTWTTPLTVIYIEFTEVIHLHR